MPNLLSRGVFNLLFGARRKALGGTLPGPVPGILGTLGDFLGASPWDVCARYGREYGGVTLIWMGGSPGLVLNDPAIIEEVLESRRNEFEKGAISEQIRPSVPEDTVFIAELRKDWAARRKADPFAQPWSEELVASQVDPMRAAIAESVEALIGKGAVDLTPELRRLTFDAFSVVAVGEKLPTSVYEDFMLLGKAADARIQAKLPLRFVSPPKGFEAARSRFYGQFAERASAARRAPNPSATHLLARLLRVSPGIDDRGLANILGGIYFGGVFSSSTTLVGAFHQLQKHPDAEERLRAEAVALSTGALTPERMRGGWIEATVYEALRILPAVRVFTRTPVTDVALAGITLPAGATILISNQHLHRDPSHWSQPDTFSPARWLNGGVARDPLGSGYFFPFGRGPRECVGGAFAIVFLQTALATIAARTKVHVDSTEPFEEGFLFGVVLPKGVTARFERV